MAGPLSGLRVIEMAGLGPCPLAGQMLADLGAEIILVERKPGGERPYEVNHRGKRSIALNLKKDAAREALMRLIESADILIEGFRPGVMERLGLGPDDCLARNPKLVFGRMTGWGQQGPLSQTAGHDINYLALTGALHMMGERGKPPMPPLNLAADYGGGTMLLLFGILSALWSAGRTGKGQVVDAAMIDGVSAMMGIFHQMRKVSLFPVALCEDRQSNLLDGGAPFYRCYETADGKYLAVGPLEPQFFAGFIRLTGLDEALTASQYDREKWPQMHTQFEALFAQKTRAEWQEIFAGSDACVTPVLTMAEAFEHGHNKERNVHADIAGLTQATPAPGFSESQPDLPRPAEPAGSSTIKVLAELGYDDEEIAQMG